MFPYKYTVIDISENNETGFKAVIPSWPHLYIVADTVKDLDNSVKSIIKEEIFKLKKQGKKTPNPDNIVDYKGILTIRVKPALHKRLADLASANEVSVNKYLNNLIQNQLIYNER
jgi:predicted HicB family RNase H-like nuclease